MSERRMRNLKGKATDKQKDTLDKFGLEYSKNVSKQDASDMISEFIEDYKNTTHSKRWYEKDVENWTSMDFFMSTFMRL